MIPTEVITLGGSYVLGAWVKIQSARLRIKEQKLRWEHKAEAQQQSGFAAARAFLPEGGLWTRRLIVCAVLFTVFIAPVVVAVFYPTVPISYAYTEESGGWLWGLFGDTMEKLKTKQMNGFVILPIHTHMASAIAGFYFGAGLAK